MTQHDGVRKKAPRFVSYRHSGWPRIGYDPTKRLFAKCFPQSEGLPRWALEFQDRLRVSAVEALQRYEAAHGQWKWGGGHYCVMMSIVKPLQTVALDHEIVDCVLRTNADLFYDAHKDSVEYSVEFRGGLTRGVSPSIFCTVFRSIGAYRHAA